MCDIVTTSTENTSNSGIDITIFCKISGKPITISNKYGMYCENLCGINKDKLLYMSLHGILTAFDKFTSKD